MDKKIKSLQTCVVILTIALCACVFKIKVLENGKRKMENWISPIIGGNTFPFFVK